MVALSRLSPTGNLSLSLLSLSRLVAAGHVRRLKNDEIVLEDTNGREVLRARSQTAFSCSALSAL